MVSDVSGGGYGTGYYLPTIEDIHKMWLPVRQYRRDGG